MSATKLAPKAQFDRSKTKRHSMYGKIAVAQKQLGMEDEDYRQGLFDVTGKISLKECTDYELHRMIEWLKSKGFRPLPGPKARMSPIAQKAHIMWKSLYQLCVVHYLTDHALEAYAKRQLGCDRLAWAKQSEGFRLIEALKSWGAREGWLQHDRCTGKQLDPLGLKASLCSAILVKLKEDAVVPADWALHDAAQKLCGIENGRAAPWTAEDYDQLASALGTKLRKFGSPKRRGGAA